MANAWFVVAPVGESQGSATNPVVPAGSKVVGVPDGSPAYKAWLGNGAYQGWQVVMGPFSSLAQAKSATPTGGLSYLGTLAGASIDTVLHQAVTSPATQAPQVGAAVSQGIPNPLTGIAAVGDFFQRLTQANTWIRVLKVGAGGAMVLIGISMIVNKETNISSAVMTAAKVVK